MHLYHLFRFRDTHSAYTFSQNQNSEVESFSRFVSRLPGRQVSQTPNTALEVHPVAIPAEPEIDTLNVSGENLQPNMAMLLTTRQTGSFLDKKVCFC